MPDTGAPWNIPYVASTDLVSDWPADSLALANAIDAGLDAAGAAGIGSNLVTTTKTDTFSTTSTSFVDVTGLSVSITPTSATSKVLVVANIGTLGSSAADFVYGRIATGGNAVIEGAASAGDFITHGAFYVGDGDVASSMTLVALDSPATTSSVTYQFQLAVVSGITGYVNRRATDSVRGASTITAVEVAV